MKQVVVTVGLLIVFLIIFGIFKRDRSGLYEGFLKLFHRTRKLQKIQSEGERDRFVEALRTICYFALLAFFLLKPYRNILFPVAAGSIFLAYIRVLMQSEKVSLFLEHKSGLGTLLRMSAFTALFFIIAVCFQVKSKGNGIIYSLLLCMVFMIPFMARGFRYLHDKPMVILVVLSFLSFSYGSIMVMNRTYGVVKMQEQQSTVAKTSTSTARTGSGTVYISEKDAVDGESYFPVSGMESLKLKKGDAVTITEYKGCLGIKWFEVEK